MVTDSERYPQWYYDVIEEPVRELVYLLRNNGYNTTNSCGHDMWVQIDMDSDIIHDLYNLLAENGYEKMIFEFYWETYPFNNRFLILRIGD